MKVVIKSFVGSLWRVGVVLSVMLGVFVVSPSGEASAGSVKECGGSIVTKASIIKDAKGEHLAIFAQYSNPRDLNTIPNMRVTFNGYPVANSQKGIAYSEPLLRVGKSGFWYGVSTTWAYLNAPRTWFNTGYWKIYYPC